MQLPLGCCSVSIKSMERLTVRSVKSSENSRRAVQAQTEGLPASVSCLYVDTQRKAVCGHSEKRMNKASTCLKRNRILPFPASKYFQFGAFPESNLLLNPSQKNPLHPQLSLASSYTSIACCAKNYFLFLVLIVSPISFIC